MYNQCWIFSLLWFIALSQLFYAHVLLLGCQKKVSWRMQNFYIVSKPFFLYMYNY